MKTMTTILSAALIVGTSSLALAQGAGSDVNPGRWGRGADANPSGIANPMAGNIGNTAKARMGQRQGYRNGMTSSNVSGTWNNGGWQQNSGWNQYQNNGWQQNGWQNNGWGWNQNYGGGWR